jgi:plastocyanin
MRRPILPAFAMLGFLALAACGGGTSASPSQASQPAGSVPASVGAESPSAPAAACEDAPSGAVAVTIQNNTFSPDPVTAKVGEAIAWTNQDSLPHTATLDDGDCGTETLNQGASGALVFGAAGEYAYHCEIHPDMRGRITITE